MFNFDFISNKKTNWQSCYVPGPRGSQLLAVKKGNRPATPPKWAGVRFITGVGIDRIHTLAHTNCVLKDPGDGAGVRFGTDLVVSLEPLFLLQKPFNCAQRYLRKDNFWLVVTMVVHWYTQYVVFKNCAPSQGYKLPYDGRGCFIWF